MEDSPTAPELEPTKGASPAKEGSSPPKKRGRPKKSLVDSKKRGNRGVRGRPKGDAAIMNELKARVLASPKSAKVLESIFNAALDDDHKNQSAAWKLLMDRILPVGAFEKEVIKDAGRNAISINISGVGHTEITSSSPGGDQGETDVLEGTWENKDS